MPVAAGSGLALQPSVVELVALAEWVVVLAVIQVVAYIVFAEQVAAVASAGLVVAESVVEQRVLLAVVMDSSQASHCSSARASSRLASRANTFLIRRFPNAGACY